LNLFLYSIFQIQLLVLWITNNFSLLLDLFFSFFPCPRPRGLIAFCIVQFFDPFFCGYPFSFHYNCHFPLITLIFLGSSVRMFLFQKTRSLLGTVSFGRILSFLKPLHLFEGLRQTFVIPPFLFRLALPTITGDFRFVTSF